MTRLFVLSGLGLMLAAGAAVAQTAPPAPAAPPPAAAPAPGGPPVPPGEMSREVGGPPHREMGMGMPPWMAGGMGPGMHGMRHGMHRPMPNAGAHFRFRKGDALVDIKCADDEPTKACVDAGSALMDKLAAQPR